MPTTGGNDRMSLDAARFAKICGLLGSDHDGERAVAARKATEMLRAAGMTWQGVSVGNGTAGAAAGQREEALGNELVRFSVRVVRLTEALDDERRRGNRLQTEINRLTKELAAAKSAAFPLADAAVAAEGAKPKKRKKRRRTAAQEAWAQSHVGATVEPIDASIREAMDEALAGGELQARTIEFFESLLRYAAWTGPQRAAALKTLRWAAGWAP